jgi:hypothetical protein
MKEFRKHQVAWIFGCNLGVLNLEARLIAGEVLSPPCRGHLPSVEGKFETSLLA